MNGKTLRMARIANSMSLTELSKSVGISVSQLSRFESNLRRPRVEALQRIAKALHVKASELAPEFNDPAIKPAPQQQTPDKLPADILEKLSDISRQDRRNPEQQIEWLIEQEWMRRHKT